MSLTLIGSGGTAFGSGGTAFGVSASYPAYATTPPDPAPTPWFQYDARTPQFVTPGNDAGDGFYYVTQVADAGGGSVLFAPAPTGSLVFQGPPQAAFGGRKYIRTLGSGLLSSAVFPITGSGERAVLAVLQMPADAVRGNVLGYGLGGGIGGIFDILTQSGVVGIHTFSNDPAAEGTAVPFPANTFFLLAIRTQPGGKYQMQIGDTVYNDVPYAAAVQASRLFWGGGAYTPFNTNDQRNWFALQLYDQGLSDAHYALAVADLRAGHSV